METKIQKTIVTSGPTKEWIDPVRYITNSSSGKMGYNLALSALAYSSEVVYIAGGTEEKYRQVSGARNRTVETTNDLLLAVLEEITDSCLLVMSAAPADYRVRTPEDRKIKKKSEDDVLVLELVANPDILKNVHKHRMDRGLQNFYVLGFSAETDSLFENAKSKLQRKSLDWIAANLVGKSIGFGEVESEVTLIGKTGSFQKIGPGKKEILAQELLDTVFREIARIPFHSASGINV